MGQLENGRWVRAPVARIRDGAFDRPDSSFRSWVTPDGRPGPTGEGGFAAESGRYHLYVSYACPWAHRTLIVRELKDLRDHIGVSVVHPDMLDEGWTFETDFPGATGDTLMDLSHLHQVYTRADPQATTKVTVPVLWDSARGTIVSNESSEIIRMMTSAWDGLTGNRLDLWPEDLREAMEPVNARVYDTVNNGVYRAGFAQSQAAYDEAVHALFDSLDWLEERLGAQRWLMGDRFTEADIRLWTTLVRFDTVYHGHFKCNRRKLIEYPALWAFVRDLHAVPGVADTLRLDHIARHYHYSHDGINPTRIVPVGPDLDLSAPHGRDALGPPALA
ncbi:glutathione S-transferase family protein [Rubellimicrobium sp. CFH 75288]|uniref:glutathione S-transferase family protein n=1 Tax=Rubellimicrobium sp. CFH 75288 TaxID=2697034 RepID=UPI001411F472|nr:glutathione S-transferase family protein [Rubellimicrobium sp. CFH 75288]NAZ37388.1 glutathione S-transferase family protein [Rubellimicrobium sp. CFH 75288]